MPTVAIVDGIRLMIFFKDHRPPHFHVALAEYRAKIDIETLDLIDGGLPQAGHRKATLWAKHDQTELMAAWRAVQAGQEPERIE